MPRTASHPQSTETREKIRSGQLGHRHTEETKAKMRAAALGRKRSAAERANISAGRIAYLATLSPEERRAASATRGMAGKRQSAETRRRIGESQRGKIIAVTAKRQQSEAMRQNWANRSPEERAAFSRMRARLNTGRTHSEETKRKIAEANKAAWVTAPESRREHSRRVIRLAWQRSAETHQDTSIERIVAARLDAEGVVYVKQKRLGMFYVDFFIPAGKRVIEVNGCYWHACARCGFGAHQDQAARDARKLGWLRKQGYAVEVVWQHDLQ